MKAGRVESIFVYAERGAPAARRERCRVEIGRGLEGDRRRAVHRALTLLSLEQWREVERELGVALPPESRRANLVVSGLDLPATFGKRVRIGEVDLEITCEVDPCGNMDRQHEGLRQALVPDWRGGVGARVLAPGTIRVGDAVEVAGEAVPAK